jgi:hypothetical protein
MENIELEIDEAFKKTFLFPQNQSLIFSQTF